ncbi:MAG: hypothetical protein C7B46_20190 [Sulfobacillus benefaciens]|uniref:Uncharacterized protein n=1 Tax=Sulfobacillus benefaciens TaxID=453960 RepID=A0A2T2WVF3_9FIRM|nr:MAG: hypothetical protein C7B46_20190 [Sulfobacillus benefaciens]
MWACIVDPAKAQDNRYVFINPMMVVALARSSNVWPEHLAIALESLALYQRRADWQKACQECRDHGAVISLEGCYSL